jgi:hypothetical protein
LTLILEIACGCFIGRIANAVLLGYIEYRRMQYREGCRSLWNNIRMVM